VDTGSREENASKQEPEALVLIESGPKLHASRSRQVRVRIRIMKLSKLSSATCSQISDSLR
jgi:hypothetical protein